MPPHPGNAEVVAKHRNAGSAQVADDRLDVIELLPLERAIEQHVVPVRRVEILDRGQGQPLGLDGFAEVCQLLDRPELVLVLNDPPALTGAFRLGDARTAMEVVDPVRDDVGGAGLAGKAEVLRRQHMTIEPEPELHRYILSWPSVPAPIHVPNIQNTFPKGGEGGAFGWCKSCV